MFYFAWVDKTDTEFDPLFAREDEKIFAFSIQHNEGDFPALDIDLVNPRVGLLSSSRKQWAWFSWDNPDTHSVEPLFFGRLIGVPQDLQAEVVRLSFVARPADYLDQLSTLAATLQVAPYYDALWVAQDERDDPDRVLEGRPSLWHIDRTSLEVSASNITAGEDGTVHFTEAEVFYDSVKVGYGQSPARKCVVTAGVQWAQVASGDIDVTKPLLDAFGPLQDAAGKTLLSHVRTMDGMIAVCGGDQLMSAWPKPGGSVGGGWTVGINTTIALIGDQPIDPVLVRGPNDFPTFDFTQDVDDPDVIKYRPNMVAWRQIFDANPGFIAQVVNLTTQTQQSIFAQFNFPFSAVSGEVQELWIPIWRLAPQLWFHYETSRDRTENVSFSLSADVQPLLTDPGEEEVISLDLGIANVDAFIHDRKSPRFFQTSRGQDAFEALIARARSALLARARAVDISFEVPFHLATGVSCRKSASLVDDRIPGGTATGKVKSYTLTMDGQTGVLSAGLVIGCTIGRDGGYSAFDGDPVYADDYSEPGWQLDDLTFAVPFDGDLAYIGFAGVGIDDDGVNFHSLNRRIAVQSLTVTGGLTAQQESVKATSYTPAEIINKINGYKTTVDVVLLPVTGGPFVTTFSPSVLDLAVPRTINLEDIDTETA